MLSHEATNSRNRRILSQTHNLSSILHTVVLERLKRNRLTGTLHLLGLGVHLLLSLLSSSTKPQDEVKGRLFLDVVVGKGAAIFQLLSGEDETLLIGGDSFLILNLGLDVVNGVGRLNIKRDGLAYGFIETFRDVSQTFDNRDKNEQDKERGVEVHRHGARDQNQELDKLTVNKVARLGERKNERKQRVDRVLCIILTCKGLYKNLHGKSRHWVP